MGNRTSTATKKLVELKDADAVAAALVSALNDITVRAQLRILGDVIYALHFGPFPTGDDARHLRRQLANYFGDWQMKIVQKPLKSNGWTTRCDLCHNPVYYVSYGNVTVSSHACDKPT